MRKSAQRAACLVLCYFGMFIVIPISARGADKKETIRQAIQAYYSLRREGITEFRCQVQPDWDLMYKGLKIDAVAQDQLLPILRKTHFEILVGPDGSSTVSHQSEVAPPNEEVAGRLRKSTAGIEQVLTGFLETWSGFMVGSPFPDVDGEYQLEGSGDKLRVSYKEGTSNIVISMTHDFVVEELSATAPQFQGAVHPKFSRNKQGFVLDSYDGGGKTDAGPIPNVSVKIENKIVDGLELPATVDAAVPTPSGVINMHLSFTSYQIKKR